MKYTSGQTVFKLLSISKAVKKKREKETDFQSTYNASHIVKRVNKKP